jgi:hypothetical protein
MRRTLYYLDVDKFGRGPVPANIDEVEAEYNRLVDEAKVYNYEDLYEFCEKLWEDMCDTGKIGEVTLIWEEEKEDEV